MVHAQSSLPTLIDAGRLRSALDNAISVDTLGTVWSVGSNTVEAIDFPVPTGAICEIDCRGQDRSSRATIPAQAIGFEGAKTLLAPLDGTDGVAPGDSVKLVAASASVRVGEGLLGRVVDATGSIIDGGTSPPLLNKAVLDCDPLAAMERPPINSVLQTGVKAIDSLLTIGLGQRIGIFAGSGVGKSRLLGMLARGTSADVIVVGLIGERGREVQEFLQQELGESMRHKCVTVVATSDQSALRRVQAAQTCTAIAEYFRDSGKNVLLLVDSVTRCAMAQREIGLAGGEAPTTRGYPPSVFSMLPRLVERSGRAVKGSITGVYTVLVEGDDPNEPISDALRGLLDGHVVLSRAIAARGRYPAIDVTASLSRLHHRLATEQHRDDANQIRKLIADFEANEDLISIGAYQEGSNPAVDRAIAMRGAVEAFLRQPPNEISDVDASVAAISRLAG